MDWTDIGLSVPPLLTHIRMNEFSDQVFANSNALLPFIEIPCHTQAVERHVKLVTEAEQSVCGERVRSGIICSGDLFSSDKTDHFLAVLR